MVYCTYFNNNAWHHIGYTLVTTALRTSAARLRHLTGIDPALLSARSLRPGGATALLCANMIDKDTIKLLGAGNPTQCSSTSASKP